ncbi:MAG: hypothetical protein IJK81_03750 [Selenomonadaceae bacterium]|nr:hypothetical protein [Selenomonadaceae bacterium]
MAKEIVDYGYTAPQYYYWANYDDGSKKISNDASNFVRDQYDAVGNHPTVSGDGATLTGGAKNDTISNGGDNVLINCNAGDDSVYNGSDSGGRYVGNNVTINGGAGKDTISAYFGTLNLEIDGGADDDSIDTTGNTITVTGGTGHDYIRSHGSDAIIDGGDGNDTLLNVAGTTLWNHQTQRYEFFESSNVTINGGNGDDKISTDGEKITIDAGSDEGCDTVGNTGISVKISTGAGMDYIGNSGDSVTIDAGVGNDTIDNYGKRIFIDAGKGEDTIDNMGNYVTIEAGTDVAKDTVYNSGSNVSISTGKHNDYIYNLDDSKNVTILAGAGNDTIKNVGSKVKIDAGAGKDIIDNSGNNVSINATAGNTGDSIINGREWDNYWYGGENVTILAGSGNDTIRNGGSKVRINANDGADKIYNFAQEVVINAGAGKDYIYNIESNVKINAGTGNDSIINFGKSVSIDATKDDKKDYFYNSGSKVTLKAGAGADSIINVSSKVTISAGDGDNQASLFGGENLSVKTGNGNDSIILFGNYTDAADYGNIVSNDYYTGKNATIDVGKGKNFVSVGSSWSNLTIKGGNKAEDWDVILNESDNALISLNAGNDYIENTGDHAIIFGGDDGDVIENYGSNVYIGADDPKTANSNSIANYIYTDKGSDVTIESGSADDTILAYNDIGASIDGGDGNDHIVVQRFSAERINNIIGGVSWFAVSNILQAKLFKFGKKFAGAIKDTLLGAGLDNADNILSLKSFLDPLEGFNNTWNLISPTSTIKGGKGNDVIVSDGLAPRTFEYAAGDGMDTIYYFNHSKPVNDDLWTMFTNALLSDINSTFSLLPTLHITSGYIEEVETNFSNEVIFRVNDKGLIKIGDESVKLIDATNHLFRLREKDGTTTTRAYGQYLSTGDMVCSIFGGAESEVIKDNAGNASETRYFLVSGGGDDKLYGNDQSDTIYASYGQNTLYGGKGADSLYSEARYNKLYGGAGKDTIVARKSYSTISGGTGNDLISLRPAAHNDVIEYEEGDGKDTVYGFDGNDTLKIYSQVYTTETKGEDLIVKVGNGSITFKYCKNLPIHVEGISEKDTIAVEFLPEGVSVEKNKLSFTKNFDGTEFDVNNLSKPIKSVDATKLDHGVEITASPKVKEFNGSKYDDVYYCEPQADEDFTPTQNTTSAKIKLGKGDDTVYSGKKTNNMYLYTKGDGRDVIYGFNAKSTLKLGNGKDTYAKETCGSDVIITVGDGEILLSDAASLSSVKVQGTLTKAKKIYNDKSKKVITGTSYSDTIENNGSRVTINAQGGDDSISNKFDGKQSSISAGAGNDFIENYGDKITILGGAGNDTINNYWADNVSIDGGTDNDLIYNHGNYTTIRGGKGNDSLWGDYGADTFIYSKGDGKDVIFGFDDNDILTFNNIEFTSSYKNEAVTFKVNGGSVTLKDFTATTFHINNDTYQISGSNLAKKS